MVDGDGGGHAAAFDGFLDGGEAGALLRDRDWSRTSLGPAEGWPAAMRAVLGTVLAAAAPMALFWGPTLVLLHNDMFVRLLGDRHPRAFGRPARAAVPELWSEIGPALTGALAGQGAAFLDRPLPLTRGGRREEAWFAYSASPVPLGDGAAVGGVLLAAVQTTAKVLAERALRESEARLRLAQEAAGIGVYERDLVAGRALWSPAMFRVWGLDPEGRSPWVTDEEYLALLLPEDREGHRAARDSRRDDPAVSAFDGEFRIRRADTGEVRWLASRGEYVRDAAGRAVLVRGTNHDVTERKAAEERQTLLMRELDHRAKNALAVVLAVVRLTPADDPAAFRRAVQGRIAALARAQTLLAEDRWTGADLRALLEGELAPFVVGPGAGGKRRVALDGPRAALPAGATQPLAMAVHELATNALKHGALSVPAGRVAVSWEILAGTPGAPGTAGRALRLRWAEGGGPPVAGPPTRRGFGTRVLDGTVRGQLGGVVSLAWAPDGLRCELTVPLPEGGAGAAPA